MIKLGETFKKHKFIVSVFCLAVICVASGLFLTQKNSDNDGVATNVEILEINKSNNTIRVKEMDNGTLLGDNCILTFDENTNFTTLTENEKLIMLTIEDFTVGDYVVVFTGEVQETYPTSAKLETMQLKNEPNLKYNLQNLLENRTENIGDNSKVRGILSALRYPDKITYKNFALYTAEPHLLDINSNLYYFYINNFSFKMLRSIKCCSIMC